MTKQQDIFSRAIEPPESFSVLPTALLLFAHPDDEVIGLGSRLGRFAAAHFVHTTDGTPPDGADVRAHGFNTPAQYREARRTEFRRVLELAGIPLASHECFGLPDQHTAFTLVDLTRRVEGLLTRLRPTVVFTHSYEGGHPDHDACAFAVQHAAAALGEAAPLVIEAAGYHADFAHPASGFLCNVFLPPPQPTPTQVCSLTAEQSTLKTELLAAYTSQRDTLQYFRTEREGFRIAPVYDFTRRPHPGPAWYDRYGWPVTSARFCELAATAAEELLTPKVNA